MMIDDNDGQMIFGDLGGLKLPEICLTGEEKPRKNLTQETYTVRGSNPGPLRDRRACCRLAHSSNINLLYYYEATSLDANLGICGLNEITLHLKEIQKVWDYKMMLSF